MPDGDEVEYEAAWAKRDGKGRGDVCFSVVFFKSFLVSFTLRQTRDKKGKQVRAKYYFNRVTSNKTH